MNNNDHLQYAKHSQLGQPTDYRQCHSADILDPIARAQYRSTVENTDHLKNVAGYDRWYCYELSWLDSLGKPQVACAQIDIPESSSAIVESKSLKLYINSFNSEQYASSDAVGNRITDDLSQKVGAEVNVKIIALDQFKPAVSLPVGAQCLDDIEVACHDYHRNVALLSDAASSCTQQREVTVYTHLFRSHCPVTNQPDWATLYIKCAGVKIAKPSLLQYLVSYREHSGFHEQCVEQIYCDILQYCSPAALCVWANFTRRGGIDINPVRSNTAVVPDIGRSVRQ